MPVEKILRKIIVSISYKIYFIIYVEIIYSYFDFKNGTLKKTYWLVNYMVQILFRNRNLAPVSLCK